MKHIINGSIFDIQSELLTVFYSGVYMSKADILKLGRELGLEYPKKSRDNILKSLLKDIESQQRDGELIEILLQYYKSKRDEYSRLSQIYPESNSLFGIWLSRIDVMEDYLKNVNTDGKK